MIPMQKNSQKARQYEINKKNMLLESLLFACNSDTSALVNLLITFILRSLPLYCLTPHWPSGYGVRLESRRSWVWIPLAPGCFRGRVMRVTLIGTSVATLPGAWRYRVSPGTCWPGVSILWLGEMESLICNFYLSVAAHKIVWADPSLRLLSNQQTTLLLTINALYEWHSYFQTFFNVLQKQRFPHLKIGKTQSLAQLDDGHGQGAVSLHCAEEGGIVH